MRSLNGRLSCFAVVSFGLKFSSEDSCCLLNPWKNSNPKFGPPGTCVLVGVFPETMHTMGWTVMGLSSCWSLLYSASAHAAADLAWCRNLDSSDMSWARKIGYREWCRFSGYSTEPSPTDYPGWVEVGWQVYVPNRGSSELGWAAQCVASATRWPWCWQDQMNTGSCSDVPWSWTEVGQGGMTVAVVLAVAWCGLVLVGRASMRSGTKLGTFCRWAYRTRLSQPLDSAEMDARGLERADMVGPTQVGPSLTVVGVEPRRDPTREPLTPTQAYYMARYPTGAPHDTPNRGGTLEPVDWLEVYLQKVACGADDEEATQSMMEIFEMTEIEILYYLRCSVQHPSRYHHFQEHHSRWRRQVNELIALGNAEDGQRTSISQDTGSLPKRRLRNWDSLANRPYAETLRKWCGRAAALSFVPWQQ